MKCYEIKTENTTYYARVLPPRFDRDRDPLAAAACPWDRESVTVFGGRFSLIETTQLPTRGSVIAGESCGRRVRTSRVISVRRISKTRFLKAV